MESKYIERPKEFDKAKYNKEHYKQLKANIKPDEYDTIDAYCKGKGVSKARFIVAACQYCIDNDIDLCDNK